MAVVLKLARTGLSDLSLVTASAAGWRTTAWNPVVATPEGDREPEPVTETMDCMVQHTSHDNLATALQAMDEYRVAAARYMRDRTEYYPAWLHAKMNNETGERRALVRKIGITSLSPLYDIAHESGHNQIRRRLAIERGGAWERTAARVFPRAYPDALAAILYDYTAAGAEVGAHDIVGDIGARVGLFGIDPGHDLGYLWMGFRTARLGITKFEPVWECESAGTLGTNAALATDATASPGTAPPANTKVTITPGTATWAKRLTYKISDEFADSSDKNGLFLWLLRAKVSAGTWEMQMRWGHSDTADADFTQGPIVPISNTNWEYNEMGINPVPAFNLRDLGVGTPGTLNVGSDWFTYQLWARRTSGVGTLDLDCVCPLPINWGCAILKDFFVTSPDSLFLGMSPNGSFSGIRDSGVVGGITLFISVQAYNFTLPPGDGRLMVVFQRPTQSVLTDRLAFNYHVTGETGEYYERWLSLRGTE